ncbi:MerR family transcriptional regulator [Cohnella sp. GCM10027633]|uniref:helix-turn-helix domain-containing protein n=1 Tax=unclassified Cohnella TaxID=2636738 RepID=UPI00362C96B7
MDKFKIDDVAKESGVTKRTIRYYEEIGLLSPPERTGGGMRLYTREDIERLKQIVNARDVLGFTLQEIIEYVNIRKELEGHKQAYFESDEAARKHEKLIEVKIMLGKQLALIDQKLEKMAEIRNDTERSYRKVCDAIDKYTT